MKTLFKLSIIIVLFAACDNHFPGDRNTFVVGEEFDIAFGESAINEGQPIELTFSEILGDSRCPADVVCVWAGNARISVEISALNSVDTLELNTHRNMATEGHHQSFKVRLIELNPYPESHDHPIPKEAYIATLLLDIEE